MALVEPPIFQIVGFQNSGKTTFLKNILLLLKKEELNIVTIKHHGHGGTPTHDESKDSFQHLRAGAKASLVEGDGHLLLHSEKQSWTLEEQIHLLTFFKPDGILVEGHKHAPYEKAVLLRTEEDLFLLDKLTNIKVIFYWDDALVHDIGKQKDIPFFPISDDEGLAWLMDYLKETFSRRNSEDVDK